MKEEKRKCLCPYCAEVCENFEKLKSHVLQTHREEPDPLPEGLVRLRINGEEFQIFVRPEWSLNYMIHDVIGLTSPKMFCDRGACGSCTVIMDGRPILSCMTLAIECDGKSIVTAEGVAAAKHPLIDAYVENHCMQCGYCTPGFLTTAKALLDRNPNPSLEEIQEALGGNLCRCGTYPQHPKAILQASKKLQAEERGVENG
jgi:aerobic-type carbon monoxide dehydrogenase small subunit (CoxS/CutS family)